MLPRKAVLVIFVLVALLAVACAQTATQTPESRPAAATAQSGQTDSPIPLEEVMHDLNPPDVFRNFYQITQIPRPSGHPERIRDFVVGFGRELGLETLVDDVGNVVIRKPAAPGLEESPVVVLQAHMDMVPEKNEDKTFEFTTDPIQAYVSGDAIVADGTTLGADNGIGMAMIMAVLQSDTLKIGPIEALFTVDEETTMAGANGISPEALSGSILINLDWESEGSFAIGSAGGMHVNVVTDYTQLASPPDAVAYQVKVQGLQGGHSGIDINRGRGHATRLLVRLLREAAAIDGLHLATLVGGTAPNAIPREATALVVVPEAQADAFLSLVSDYQTTVQSELSAVDPGVQVTAAAAELPPQVMDESFQATLLNALHASPQGVLRMSDAVPGLVETSTNIGIVTVANGRMEVVNFPRSSVESELDDAGQMLADLWGLAGYQTEFTDRFAAWTPNPTSPILALMKEVYAGLYGREPAVEAVHAGLETGAIGGIYPTMDMISIGPTLSGVHSPDEKLVISSVDKAMALLTTTLGRLAVGTPVTESSVAPVAAADVADTITARMLVTPGALMGPGPSSFNWSPVGATLLYVAPLEGHDALWTYDAAAAEKHVDVVLDPGDNPNGLDLSSAQWSPTGDRILLAAAASLWMLDPQTSQLQPLPDSDGVTGVTFSPSGDRLAFVRDNDLYIMRLDDGTTTRLTADGSETVFNGTLDWVYNEELATRSAQPAYAWSPDGNHLVYLRLDESEVQSHPVTDYHTIPPSLSYTRYPTAGSANPLATLQMIDLISGETAPIPLPPGTEYVMPFLAWFPDSTEAVFVTVNRDHTTLELNGWNAQTATGRIILSETDPNWINENSYVAPVFLDDGNRFLWLSERDGFMHLYLLSREGDVLQQLTQGDWMIDTPAWNLLIPGKPVHVDPTGRWAYFSATKNGPLERHIFRLDLSSGELMQITQPAGFHFGALSADGQYLVDQYSDVDTPPVTRILRADGTEATVLARRAGPALSLPAVSREFVTISANDGTNLYAQIVKPADFDPEKQYPVIVHWYGGPTLQMVSNRYGATNLFNHIERDVLYTQAGFIIWRLDNRGSFGRGRAFETPIFGELGKDALDDQLAGIEYLRSLPYVDADRIGCDGKSFGGYLSLYALIHAPDVFRAGVVGSAPTRWEYYDTIYTERYIRTPEQNPEGYAATDLIAAAAELQTAPLIIHGLNDTNVHLQNAVNLIERLEQLDKPFEFLPLPTLSHSYRGDGLVAALTHSVEYFERMLGDE